MTEPVVRTTHARYNIYNLTTQNQQFECQTAFVNIFGASHLAHMELEADV